MAEEARIDEAEQSGNDLGLTPDLYASLRGLARYHLRSQRRDITLNCTALVHEAYLKIVSSRASIPDSPRSYATLASLAMRQILVDYVRQKRSVKHGGEARKVTLHDPKSDTDTADYDILDIDRAMSALGARDPYLEELVALRFFAGLSTNETAEALERSPRSVERDWARARVYLYRALEDRDGGHG